MDETGMSWSRMCKWMGTAMVGGSLAACVQFDESGLPGSTSSMARNQIMLVQEKPPSFGFGRLKSRMAIYPDLGLFVGDRGLPDFLAETKNRNQDYFILYYLLPRQAYACRTRSNRGKTLEFSGPYPITDRELQTLEGFRAKEMR